MHMAGQANPRVPEPPKQVQPQAINFMDVDILVLAQWKNYGRRVSGCIKVPGDGKP